MCITIAAAMRSASASLRREVGDDGALGLGGDEVGVDGLGLAEAPEAADRLVDLLEAVVEADEAGAAQCCQFMPKPQIDGLVTSTRMRPSLKSISLRSLSSSVVGAAHSTAPGMALVSASLSALRLHHQTNGPIGGVSATAPSDALGDGVARAAMRSCSVLASIGNSRPVSRLGA
jgi:hypothetical protein